MLSLQGQNQSFIMKFYLLSILAVFFSLSIIAQTPEQLVRVKKETNSAKLLADANIYRQQSEEQKAIAIQAALQNGWPLVIESENNFMELMALDPNGNPLYYTTTNADAAESTSTDQLYSGGGLGLSLDGTGMTAGEWDGGAVLTTHQEFNNTGSSRVTQVDSPSSYSDHATHVAGTIIGGGVVAQAKGMAYNANLLAHYWDDDVSEMATAAADPTNLLISNHSYGYVIGWYYDGGWLYSGAGQEFFGYYYSETASWDQVAVDAPYYLIVKSAGNDRGDGPGTGSPTPNDGPYDCIPPKGVAKNILTVGAAQDVLGGYSGDPNDVEMTSFSSWGPADDGRIKPDICGNGYTVYSAAWNDDFPTETNWYGTKNGTSMSSPNVTGSLLLLQEHYYDLNSAWMKSATLKALAIQTADECGPDDGPDYMFGWGLLNTETATNTITNRNINALIEEDSYSGSNKTYTVTANGTDPLRATLVWTDPAGTPPSVGATTPMLVNDLDMTITGAKTTYSPYKLDRTSPSSAATTGDNDVDNVEQIHIASPTNSSYTITITHEGSITDGPQEFSLIVTGIVIDEPAVVTYEPSSITGSSVFFEGEVTAENGSSVTARGFVYGESENPNINDDNVVPDGSGLGSFSETVSGLDPNTTYHVRAYATNSSGTAYGDDKDFTTTSTTTWNGSSWDAGAPTASIHAVIDGNYTSSGNLECNNLTINTGKTFNVSVNDGVTVNGDFTNNGTFNIKSNASGIGSLITLGTVSNNGTFNMERYVSNGEWHLISIPMSGMTAADFAGDYLQYWDESNTYYYEITTTGYPLALGMGYALWPSSKATTYTWTGTPHTGTKHTSMSFTDFENNVDDHEGANLMGNIFPSSIDWSTLDENLYGSVYYFNGTNYSSWNSEGGVNGGTQYIPPGQGFFVIVDYAPATLSLGDANRTHNGTSTYWKSNDQIDNGVKLITSGNNLSDELLIEFREDTYNNFDKKSDAYMFFSGNDQMPEIWTFGGNSKLSIDRRPETNIIQLGYRCQTNGQYSIDISQADGIGQAELEDTKTNKLHNLLNGPYEFEWSTGDSEERFKLHLSATATQELTQTHTRIYSFTNQIYISQNEPSENAYIKVYNSGGQLVFESPLEEKNLNRFALNVEKGVYLVQLIGENQSLTEKIIIK